MPTALLLMRALGWIAVVPTALPLICFCGWIAAVPTTVVDVRSMYGWIPSPPRRVCAQRVNNQMLSIEEGSLSPMAKIEGSVEEMEVMMAYISDILAQGKPACPVVASSGFAPGGCLSPGCVAFGAGEAWLGVSGWGRTGVAPATMAGRWGGSHSSWWTLG